MSQNPIQLASVVMVCIHVLVFDDVHYTSFLNVVHFIERFQCYFGIAALVQRRICLHYLRYTTKETFPMVSVVTVAEIRTYNLLQILLAFLFSREELSPELINSEVTKIN
jgi:hypothetical protein